MVRPDGEPVRDVAEREARWHNTEGRRRRRAASSRASKRGGLRLQRSPTQLGLTHARLGRGRVKNGEARGPGIATQHAPPSRYRARRHAQRHERAPRPSKTSLVKMPMQAFLLVFVGKPRERMKTLSCDRSDSSCTRAARAGSFPVPLIDCFSRSSAGAAVRGRDALANLRRTRTVSRRPATSGRPAPTPKRWLRRRVPLRREPLRPDADDAAR